jgi:hypothetical protein
LEKISEQFKQMGDLPIEQIVNLMMPDDGQEAEDINNEFISKRHKL